MPARTFLGLSLSLSLSLSLPLFRRKAEHVSLKRSAHCLAEGVSPDQRRSRRRRRVATLIAGLPYCYYYLRVQNFAILGFR